MPCVATSTYLRQRPQLLRAIYADDPYYRDADTPLVKLLLRPRGEFARRAIVQPVVVLDRARRPAASCLLTIARGLPQTVQVGFFEALPDQEQAVDALLDDARALAAAHGATEVVVGMNGHVNNGLGFLASPTDEPVPFGSPYNPPYYLDYLAPRATDTASMESYRYDVASFSLDRERRILDRVARRVTVRPGRFRDLKAEMAIYTDLNNRCFAHHDHYFERAPEEDYELFKSFGPFLREENFLVAEHEGTPIGFLLWYPDFCQLVPPGAGLGLGTLLKLWLAEKRITRFRLAEFGVLPNHQGTGAVLALIAACHEHTRGRYQTCESGWILDTNFASTGVSRRWGAKPYRTYQVFRIDLGEAGG